MLLLRVPLNPDGTRCAFSNAGPWVRTWALGGNVVSTLPVTFDGPGRPVLHGRDPDPFAGPRATVDPDGYGGGFGIWSGSSFAGPLVAARIARALAGCGGDLGVRDVRGAGRGRGSLGAQAGGDLVEAPCVARDQPDRVAVPAEPPGGRRAEARAAFERASGVFPIAQSARVALSRYDVADSRAADGVAGMLRSSGPDAPRDAGDPWWWYYRVHEPDSKALLAKLRAGAR